MAEIITDPSAPPPNDGLDNSQRLLIKRARVIGTQLGAKTLPTLLAGEMGGMSAVEVAHLYAGTVAGLCGAAMQQLPASILAEILESTALAIRQHPDAIRGALN